MTRDDQPILSKKERDFVEERWPNISAKTRLSWMHVWEGVLKVYIPSGDPNPNAHVATEDIQIIKCSNGVSLAYSLATDTLYINR